MSHGKKTNERDETLKKINPDHFGNKQGGCQGEEMKGGSWAPWEFE